MVRAKEEVNVGFVISNGEDKQQVTDVQERRKCFLTRHRTLHNVELQNHSQIKQSQQNHSIFSKNKILFHQILFVL